jgi:hypothetical protein
MLQEPDESVGIEGFTRGKDYGIGAAPGSVDIRPVSNEQLHHGRS